MHTRIFYIYTVSLGLMLLSCASSATPLTKAQVSGILESLIPRVVVDSVMPAPVNGFYQVRLGADIVYITEDGQFLLNGDILALNDRQNLTEKARAEARAQYLAELDEKDYIEFPAKNKTANIYVFTDVDCGYCLKLHQDVEKLNDLGISVRYLAYPRAGVDSRVGFEMDKVWCAKNRKQALTNAKFNRSFPDSNESSCRDTIADQYKLGADLGVRGTPAIFLENGRSLPGYVPPVKLIEEITQ